MYDEHLFWPTGSKCVSMNKASHKHYKIHDAPRKVYKEQETLDHNSTWIFNALFRK